MVLGCFYSHITAAVQEKGIFLEQAMDIVREHGITAVDINSADLQPSPEAFKTLLDKHGLHVASTHAYFPCGVATQEEYDASLARMKKDMHKAAKAGSTFFMPVPQKAPLSSGGGRCLACRHPQAVFRGDQLRQRGGPSGRH